MGVDEALLRDLMLRGLAGEACAYRELLRRLSDVLRAFFSRRLRSGPADVDDLVQDTLMAVHSRRITYDCAQAFTPWLFAIARHKLMDHFRRAGRKPTHVEIDDTCREEIPEDAIMARRDLDRLLETLPERQQSVVRCMKIEGATASEAANRFNMTESNVKVMVHRALKALADRVRSDGSSDGN